MIKTKAEFLSLSQSGKLGNFLRTWACIGDIKRDGYKGYLTIRSRIPGSPYFIPVTRANRHYTSLNAHVAGLVRLGANPANMYFQQIPDPAARRLIQFEAMRDERGVYMHYELDTTNPLRGIRERGIVARGVSAVEILKAYLSPSSYDDLSAIWDLHPASIIEATEFSRPVGELHRTLLFWEVREY